MLVASMGHANVAKKHGLSGVRTAHDERDAAKESASGKHDAISTRLSKALCIVEDSKGRAMAAGSYGLSSVHPAHDERHAAKESASANHDAIPTTT